MTRIKYRSRPVWHQTGLVDSQSSRSICVAETPANLLIRLKGCRAVLQLPWNIAMLRAAMLTVQINRLQKANRRRSVKRGVTIK